LVINDQLVVFGISSQRYALPINNVSEIKLGLIVDTVNSVSRYSEDEVEKTESVSEGEQFIKGIVHQGNDMILLLNLHEIMD